jgi:hypothetical protein
MNVKKSIQNILRNTDEDILRTFSEYCGSESEDATSNVVADHASLALVRYMWQKWGVDPVVEFGFKPEDLDTVLSSGD